MRSAQMRSLIRRHARAHDLTVRELPGRGKGSHRLYALEDASGSEVARFGLTGHARDRSWTVMEHLEDGLAHLFGAKWTEIR